MLRRTQAIVLSGDSVPLSERLERGEPSLISVPYARAVTLLFDGCPNCGNQALTFETNGEGEESEACKVLGARCPNCHRTIGFRRTSGESQT